MARSRPSREESMKMGVVPYSGNGSYKGNSNHGNNSGPPSTAPTSNASYSPADGASFPNVNSSQKSGSNDQLWQNNGIPANGAPQGWSNSNQGNGGNWQSNVTNWSNKNGNGASAPPQQPQQSSNYQPQQPSNSQPQQPSNYQPQHSSNYQPQEPPNFQQQSSFDSRQVRDGIPIPTNPNNVRQIGNNPQQNSGSRHAQGALITQRSGSNRAPMPKGDYVYYDGKGNQIQPPNGSANGPADGGSGSEKHFHHHHYYQQQPSQQLSYPNNKQALQKKKRNPAATALIAALVTCWACTCCCHAPCGF